MMQLAQMEDRVYALGGGGFDPRVQGTSDVQRMQRRVDAMVDYEEKLRARQSEDYELIDHAYAVLYGKDGTSGLSALVPTWWCDCLWWHYLTGYSWARTATTVGYSEQRCKQVRDLAFEIIDSWGLHAVVSGKPLNSIETFEADQRRKDAKH